MLKSELRKQAMSQRKQLDSKDFNQLNSLLLQQFKSLNFTDTNSVHIFIPIEEKREPDTFPMINWLQKAHPNISIVVPRADFDSLLLTHHEYKGSAYLVKNAFNILEPENKNFFAGKIDRVFIPLLAFDLRGYRVGYGKGFYDRFLSGQTDVEKIGISLFGAVDQIDDTNQFDIRLDGCLSPEKLYRF